MTEVLIVLAKFVISMLRGITESECFTKKSKVSAQRGFEDLQNAVYCAIVSKIIAHSLTESIPREMVYESLNLAYRYTKKLVWHTELPVKQKLYFALFSILGPNRFRSLMHMRNAHRSKSD